MNSPIRSQENAEFEAFMAETFDRMKELFLQKNAQYSTDDPLANFRTAALMHSKEGTYTAMYEEAKNFMRKHIAHIENNGIGGHKVAESLGDVMVYCGIMSFMVDAYHKCFGVEVKR